MAGHQWWQHLVEPPEAIYNHNTEYKSVLKSKEVEDDDTNDQRANSNAYSALLGQKVNEN